MCHEFLWAGWGRFRLTIAIADVGAAHSENRSDSIQSGRQPAATMWEWMGKERLGNGRVGRSCWGGASISIDIQGGDKARAIILIVLCLLFIPQDFNQICSRSLKGLRESSRQ